MPQRKTLLYLASLIVALLAAGASAAAGRKFEGFPLNAVVPYNGADAGSGFAVLLPDAQMNNQDPGFALHWMPPRGYRRNSPITLTLHYLSTSQTACGGYVFRGEGLLRSRPGENLGQIPVDGGSMVPADGNDILPQAIGVIGGKSYVINADPNATLFAGDALTIGFARDVTDPADACTDELAITGIRIEYRTK